MLSTMRSRSERGDHPADGLFDLIAEPRRLLDSHSRLGAHVQLDLSGVDGGEEVSPEEGHQGERHDDRSQESEHEGAPAAHREFQDVVIAPSDGFENGVRSRAGIARRRCGRGGAARDARSPISLSGSG